MALIAERQDDHDLDAIVIGRAGLDLYPLPPGTKTADADSFMSDMGGSAGNIAAAMAQLGRAVALAAPVSDDPVGQFVRRKLDQFGIVQLITEPVLGDPRTTLALAELMNDGSETVIYRNNAADFALTDAALAPHLLRAPLVVATGTALAKDPSRSATLHALATAETAVLDLDYRPYSWPSLEDAAQTYAEAARQADIIVGNDEEFAILAGDGDPRAHAASLEKTVFFKEGARGCTAFQPGEAPVFLPAFSVTALKPFGAGDAFLGGTLAALGEGRPLAEAMARGAAGAALVVTRAGCASAMPTAPEIDAFLSDHEAR